MEELPPNDILQISMNLYRLLGETGKNNSKLLYLFRIFNCVTLIIAIVFTTASFGNVQGDLYMKSMEGALTASHILIKYIWLMHYKQDIHALVSKTKSFWSYTERNTDVSRNVQKLHFYIKTMKKFTLVISVNNMLMIGLRPAFNDKDGFIFNAWVPSGDVVWETLALFSQYHVIVSLIPVILGCDFLYISQALHMVSQLRMLSYELEHMENDVDMELIRKCVRQHQLMLSMFNEIKRMFLWLLVLHYFVTLFTGCTQMYLIMVGNTKSVDIFITSMHVFLVIFEFSFYTFPIEAVVTELKYITTAIYMSSWYEKDIKQKKLLLFIMMKSQQQKYISVGGFMDMNVDTFGSVVRKIFSFCAVLKNIIRD